MNSKAKALTFGISCFTALTGFSQVWDNGGVGNDWSTVDNWSTNASPNGNGTAETLNIPGTSVMSTTFNDLRTVTIGGGHTVMQTGSAFLRAQSGGHLYIGDATGDGTLISDSTAATQSLSNSIRLGRTVGSTGTLTLNGSSLDSSAGGWIMVGEAGNGVMTISDGQLTGNSDIYIAGQLGSHNNATGILNVAGGTIRSTGTSLWRIGSAANTAGTVNITAGELQATGQFNSGNAATAAGHFNISGGTFSFADDFHAANAANSTTVINLSGTGSLIGSTGSSELTIARAGLATLNQTGGTVTANADFNHIGQEVGAVGVYNMSSGTLNAIASTQFAVGLRGTGTFNISGDAFAEVGEVDVDRDNVGTGTVNQTGGVLTTPSVRVRNSGTYNLDGGELRTDRVAMNGGGAFNWGGGTLTTRSNGAEGATDDFTSPGFTDIRVGTELDVTGSIVSDTSGSTLDLGAVYVNSGKRFNQVTVSGTLDLGNTETLEFNVNPYLLRPNIGQVIETGSLVLVDANTLSGTFENFVGVENDVIGWAEFTGAFVDVTSLTKNTWFLEQNVGTGEVLFHFNVEGTVPEPGTMGLLALGILVVRRVRSLGGDRERTRSIAGFEDVTSPSSSIYQ